MNIKWKFAIFSLLIIFSRVTLAKPTLDIVAGQLVGAKNVDVGGTLYDVEFLDGTCAALFSGCDGPDDFTFTSAAQVSDAARTLLDTVFLDIDPVNQFDSSPELTQGCAIKRRCVVVIPYKSANLGHFRSAAVFNYTIPRQDAVRLIGYYHKAANAMSLKDATFARWKVAAVP